MQTFQIMVMFMADTRVFCMRAVVPSIHLMPSWC